jgi:hypothetical protein
VRACRAASGRDIGKGFISELIWGTSHFSFGQSGSDFQYFSISAFSCGGRIFCRERRRGSGLSGGRLHGQAWCRSLPALWLSTIGRARLAERAVFIQSIHPQPSTLNPHVSSATSASGSLPRSSSSSFVHRLCLRFMRYATDSPSDSPDSCKRF